MDIKEKLASIIKYKEKHEDLLKSVVPYSHKHSPETYKAYLRNEIRLAQIKIDKLTLI